MNALSFVGASLVQSLNGIPSVLALDSYVASGRIFHIDNWSSVKHFL